MCEVDGTEPDEVRSQRVSKEQGEEAGAQPPRPPARRLPPVLQNWQVIEGEATLVDVTVEDGSDRHPDPDAPLPLREQVDAVVVLLLHTRRVEVSPGGIAELRAEVINNGDRPALFEIVVEGWVDEAWFPDLPVRLAVQPGERKPVSITVAPPHSSQARAGEHAVAVAAYASNYPNHSSRISATLVVAPYDEFTLELAQPLRLASTYLQRTAATTLALTNLGNRAASFELAARDRSAACVFEFWLPGADAPRTGRAEVTVGPGQVQQVSLQIHTGGHPLVGLGPKETPFRVAARRVDAIQDRQVADGRLACAPLLGSWQLAGLAIVLVIFLFGVGLAGLGLLVAMRQAAAPAIATTPVPAPAPIIALVLGMDQAVPARAPDAQGASGQARSAATVVQTNRGADGAGGWETAPVVLPDQVTAPGEPTRALPADVVLPEQVTAPGEPTRIPSAAAPVVVRPQAADTGSMTYAQMFRAIGQRYDVDWRLLAAIAYVESGFDSLALGDHGDLGLMQIRPTTWQEWAPLTEADDPFDSYDNVLVGAAYLDYLRNALGKQGYPQREWMLVAYNWGPDKALDFLNGGGGWDSLDAEVRDYVTEVLRVTASIPAN